MSELNLESKFAGKAEIPIILGDERRTHIEPKAKYYAWDLESYGNSQYFNYNQWTQITRFYPSVDSINSFKVVYISVCIANTTLFVFEPEIGKEYNFINAVSSGLNYKLRINKMSDNFMLEIYPYHKDGSGIGMSAYIPTVIGAVERIG